MMNNGDTPPFMLRDNNDPDILPKVGLLSPSMDTQQNSSGHR